MSASRLALRRVRAVKLSALQPSAAFRCHPRLGVALQRSFQSSAGRTEEAQVSKQFTVDTSSTGNPERKPNDGKLQTGLGLGQVPLSDIKGDVTPLSRYNQLVEAGALRDDEHQRGIVAKLEKLHQQLRNYHPPPVPDHIKPPASASESWTAALFGSKQNEDQRHIIIDPSQVPRGMYLFGDVGCGKTMLMDMFYNTLPEHLHSQRRRVHFHAFMTDVFQRVHAIKHGISTVRGDEEPRSSSKRTSSTTHAQARDRIRKQREYDPMQGKTSELLVGVEALPTENIFTWFKNPWNKHRGGSNITEEDAIVEAAREMAEEARILCFDEFQVTDIVTAMILRQLIERLLDYGTVCVVTSNRTPDDLYKNGIQRDSFIPCIDLIKERFDVVDLDSKTGESTSVSRFCN